MRFFIAIHDGSSFNHIDNFHKIVPVRMHGKPVERSVENKAFIRFFQPIGIFKQSIHNVLAK